MCTLKKIGSVDNSTVLIEFLVSEKRLENVLEFSEIVGMLLFVDLQA